MLDLHEKVDPYGGTENVVVCGNTYAICKKLESLRDADFRRTKQPVPSGASQVTLSVPPSLTMTSAALPAPGSPTVMAMDLHGLEQASVVTAQLGGLPGAPASPMVMSMDLHG